MQYHQQVNHPSNLEVGQRIYIGNKSFDMITSIFIKENEFQYFQHYLRWLLFYKLNETIAVPDIIRKMCKEL